jgi:SAM-dependent methyltransferase
MIAPRTLCSACGEETPHEKLYDKAGCELFRCGQCGLGSTNVPKNLDPGNLYDESYFTGGQRDGYVDYVGSEAVLRSEFRRTVNFVKRRCRPGSRLLEIGCAYGFFLLEAREQYDCIGIELAERAVQYAQDRALNILPGIADAANLSHIGKVDIIIMLDVIEHLPNPYETLTLCERYLNPGGAIMFTTGDFGSTFAKVTGKNWRLMTPPQHLFFFTKASVDRIARRLGMTIETFDHPWKTVPLSLILFQLPRLIGLRLEGEPPKIGNSIGFPVNLFDAMRVVLRKCP